MQAAVGFPSTHTPGHVDILYSIKGKLSGDQQHVHLSGLGAGDDGNDVVKNGNPKAPQRATPTPKHPRPQAGHRHTHKSHSEWPFPAMVIAYLPLSTEPIRADPQGEFEFPDCVPVAGIDLSSRLKSAPYLWQLDHISLGLSPPYIYYLLFYQALHCQHQHNSLSARALWGEDRRGGGFQPIDRSGFRASRGTTVWVDLETQSGGGGAAILKLSGKTVSRSSNLQLVACNMLVKLEPALTLFSY